MVGVVNAPRQRLAICGLFLSPLLPVAALAGVMRGRPFLSPQFHFLVVSSAAIGCAVVATALGVRAARRGDSRAGGVAVAFTVLFGMLAIHGLSTPGFIEARPSTGIVVAGAGAVPVGGLVLAAAVLLPARLRRAARAILIAEAAALAIVVAAGAIALALPSAVPSLPVVDGTPRGAAIVTGTALYLVVALRPVHTFALTRRLADLAVVLGMITLAGSIGIYLSSPVWSFGFWCGHALQVTGFALVCGALARDLRRRAPSQPLVRDLELHQLATSDEELLGRDLHALLAALEARDPSTREHTRRVASLAVGVGAELRLPLARQRTLAVAALMHDVGKLRTPIDILRKPGRLDDAEFAEIRMHPQHGVEILRRVGGFRDVEPLIAAHHERLDGSGYPCGLRGDEVPLEARILAVCDVFDALTSDRAYRGAWTCADAVAQLVRERGTRLDAAAVDALLAIVGEAASPERAAA
jgi:putative nucleotidyltransferase with HDIG domain